MTDLVDPSEIERIVGHKRRPLVHQARAVTADKTLYILHSVYCTESRGDLRDCPYSIALDDGIDLGVWKEYMNQPVVVAIINNKLLPFPLVVIGAE